MSDDNIEIIRARHLRDDRWRNLPSMICPQAHDDRATLLAEDERHRAEIERLREALTDMLSGWRYIRETYGDLAGVGWDRVEQKARNALEGKP